MTTIVTILCDRCYAKLGRGSTRMEARLNGEVYGLQRLDDLDLCTPCLELEVELWGDA